MFCPFSSSADQEFVPTPDIALSPGVQRFTRGHSVMCSSSVCHWGLPKSKWGLWHLHFTPLICALPDRNVLSPSPTAVTSDSNHGEKLSERNSDKKKILNKVWHSLKLLLETLRKLREFGCVIFILSTSVQFLLYRLYLNVSDCIKHCYYWMWNCAGLLCQTYYTLLLVFEI